MVAASRHTGWLTIKPMLDRVADFAALIAGDNNDTSFAVLGAAEQTGKPLGTKDFITGLEGIPGRRIARRAPGRRPAQSLLERPKLLLAGETLLLPRLSMQT